MKNAGNAGAGAPRVSRGPRPHPGTITIDSETDSRCPLYAQSFDLPAGLKLALLLTAAKARFLFL